MTQSKNAKSASTSYPTSEMLELYQAMLTCKTPEELADFCRDLLTLPEIKEFTNRWQIVKLLLEDKPYLAIAEELNVSTTTVTRVAHWLHHGQNGYQRAVKRLYNKNI